MRRRLLGLVALLAIVGIIVGLPVVLLALGANPLDMGVPSWDEVTRALTSPDDGTFAVGLIKVVAWLAWAFLTVSLLVEILSRLRGVRVPRLPGLRWPQTAARGLVGAAILLFVAVPSVNVAHAAPAPDHVSVAVEQAAEQAAEQRAAEAAAEAVRHEVAAVEEAAPESQAPSTTTHTVRQGESLWSIAESKLGDGHRFGEIVELNADLLGGQASFLSVGWELTIPVDGAAPSADADGGAEAKSVTVVRGDTLSQIAQDELGDASRYPEIFEASRGIEQPGGARLSNPDVIDVGWTVQVPGTEASAPVEAVHEERVEPPADVPVEEPAGGHVVADGGAAAAQSGAVGAPGLAGVGAAAGGSSTSTASPERSMSADPATDQTHAEQHVLRSAAGVGAILGAGILALVTARRRTLHRLRRPGQRVPAAPAELLEAEADLCTTAAPLSVETVDVALRSLARSCAAAGAPLPPVRAGRLTATAFDLYLTEPASLPAPWVGSFDGTVWRIDAERARQLPVGRGIPAPCPTLVTAGHDDDGHLFLNLEQLGGLSVAGDETARREVLGAIAVELATSPWADDLQVTVVGGFDDLERHLQTGRVRAARSVERVLDELTERVARDRRALAAAGATDVGQARSAGVAPDAWTPEVVLVMDDLTDAQREQLDALVSSPRVAVSVVATDTLGSPWRLDLGAGGTREHAVLAPIGFELRPQRLPTDRYGHLLSLVRATGLDALQGTPVREPSLAEVETIVPVEEPDDVDPDAGTWDTDPDATHVAGRAVTVPDDVTRARTTPRGVEQTGLRAPRVTVLGPVDVLDAGGSVAPGDRARLLELATYLTLHPGTTPQNPTELSKLRRWLGAAPDGTEFLPRHPAGTGYRFHPAVSADVVDWDGLIGRHPADASTEDLQSALALVRGAPFDVVHRHRYVWAEPERQRLVAEIVDVSYELARRRLLEGRWRAAERAVAVGLSVEPAQECLWRMRILAAHQSRDVDTESRAVQGLLTVTDQLACDLEPQTAQLLAALQHPHGEFDRMMADAF
nr:LysM peptidoglycan-binding domain-containing protein [Isoptericola halotolerans]